MPQNALPVVHTATVRDREIEFDLPIFIQNNIAADAIDLDLDEEWSGLSILFYIGIQNQMQEYVWTGSPVTLSSAITQHMGKMDFTVKGVSADGTVRLVTKKASGILYVAPSGAFDGTEVTPDDYQDLIGQLIAQTVTKAGGEFIGNIAVNTGTEEPNITVKRTVDGAEHTGTLRIDSDGVLNLRHMVGSETVNNLYLEQTKTRLRKPLDVASGGVPTGGTSGQVLKMGQNGAEWTDSVVAGATVADVAARDSLAVVDDPASPTSGVIIETKEDGKTSIRGVEDKPVDEIKVADVDVSTADDYAAVNAGSVRDYVQSVGNVLKGTATGTIAHAEDAYSSKPREIVVKGKTVQNLWVNPSMTAGGITATANDDGSVTLSGVTTGPISLSSNYIYTIKPNTTYTISIDDEVKVNGVSSSEPEISFCVSSSNGVMGSGINAHIGYGGYTSVTFTTADNITNVVCRLFVGSSAEVGAELSGTYRIMLNEGSEALPWCPPGLSSVDEVELVTAGKNLLVPVGGAVDGVTYEVTEDGGVKVTGNSGDATSVKFLSVAGAPADDYWGSDDGLHRKLSPGNYFLSGSDGVVKIYCNIYYSDGSIIDARDTGSGCSFEIKDGYIGLNARLVCPVGEEMDTTVYPQLELGSTATAFEPSHQVTVTTIDLDGHSLRSLPDGTCDELNIDANGKATLIKRVESVFIDSDEDWTIRSDTSDFNANGNDAYNSQRISATFGNSYDNIFCDTYAISRVPNPSMPRNTVRKDYAGNYIICAVEQGTSPNDCTVLYSLATPQAIPLSPITLPALPAPVFNVWANAEAEDTEYAMAPDAEVGYERDLNMAFSQLEEVVNGLIGE